MQKTDSAPKADKNMPKWKKVMNITINVVLILLLLLTTCAIIITLTTKSDDENKINMGMGFAMLKVATGSMSPEIEPKDVVFVVKTDTAKLKEKDIITFYNSSGKVVTHRIDSITESGDFITKGDANNTTDGVIGKNQVIGRVAFTIPSFGKFIEFTKTTTGFLCVVVLPLMIIVIIESVSIVSKLKKLKALEKAESEEKIDDILKQKLELEERLKRLEEAQGLAPTEDSEIQPIGEEKSQEKEDN